MNGKNSQEPRVVIAGGGFGGLYAAKAMSRLSVKVIILDKHNYHLFRPMLYQVATGLLSANEIAAPIRSILRKQKNAEVLMEEVIGVDPNDQVVITRNGKIPYDYLILATGIRYNYFGHEDWKAIAPGLDSVDDAQKIRGKILRSFEVAERVASQNPEQKELIQELLTFVVVGAGTAGVEMAGTIAEMARIALKGDFRKIDPTSARIFLFEAAPRVLPTYPSPLSEKAHQHLQDLGVQVHTNAPVENVDSLGVTVGGRLIRSKAVIWTAGVIATGAGKWINAEVDKSGRIKVNPDLTVPGYSNIFAIGDTAYVVTHSRNLFGIRRKNAEALPGVAQPAIQGGRYVASVIHRRINGLPAPRPFWYWDKGNLAVVGRIYAVADLNFLRFAGFFAWLLWAGVHIYFLIGFANRLVVMLRWGFAFLTKQREVRIFPEE
jgi:NADH:quinone reductase (non-electrogenic)